MLASMPGRDLQAEEGIRDVQAAAAAAPATAQPLAGIASAMGNQLFCSALPGGGGGVGADGRVDAGVESAIAAGRGSGTPLDAGVRERLAPGLGDPLDDVHVHTGPEAAALADAVSARAFATGTDVYFNSGQYRPGDGDGDHLIAHELAHVVQQRGADSSGPLRVTDPGGELECDAEQAAAAALSGARAAPAVARSPATLARTTDPPAADPEAGKKAQVKGKDYSDGIVAIVGGITSVVNFGSALRKGQNGVQTLTLPVNLMSPRDKQKLGQIVLFRLLNAYCDRYVQAHPEVIADTPVPAPAPTGKGKTPPPPPPPPTAPSAGAAPTASAGVSDIDAEIMGGVKDKIAGDVKGLWKEGVWPDGKEYLWSEDNAHDKPDAIGVTGAIAFSNLKTRTLKDTPTVNENARRLGVTLEPPGELVVRQIVGGTLDRSGGWTSSLWDNLAVNIPTADGAEEGPDGSASISVQTNWLWDDNTTTWDFFLTVNDDGTPKVEDHHAGTPDDSRFFDSGGEAGKHHTFGGPKPAERGGAPGSYGGQGNVGRQLDRAVDERPAAQRLQTGDKAVSAALARTVQQRASAPVVGRALPAVGAAIAAFLASETVQIVGTVVSGIASAGSTIAAVAQGTTGVAAYNLPGNQMSEGDARKLRQLVGIKLINAYSAEYLRRHPDLDDPDATSKVPPPTSPPAPTPAGETPKPTNAPTSAEIDETILNLVKGNIQEEISKMWNTGVGTGKSYTWGEDNTSAKESIGISGTISFSNLRTRAIKTTPTLNAAAKKLGVNVPEPGELVIRQVLSGTLDGTIDTSLWDDLAINPQPAVVSDGGPDGSVQMNIGTNWLWDKNMTVWDFVLTVGADGVPIVQDARNGVPGDSEFIEWGDDGGTHKSLRPTGGADAKVAKP